MKRRGFLGALTALVVAPKALDALAKAAPTATDYNAAIPGLIPLKARILTIDASEWDDYEEGTFTESGGATVRYTRVGRTLTQWRTAPR